MRKTFLFTVLLFTTASSTILAQGAFRLPPASPKQVIQQGFMTGHIAISYSRPSLNGRKAFGHVIPYGQVWRTGSDSVTRIYFSVPVEINGKKLDSGTYALYTIPGQDLWEVILNKGINNWGTIGYKESDDVLRFRVEPTKLKKPVETLTITIGDITKESCGIDIAWEKLQIRIPVTGNAKDLIKGKLEAALNESKPPYWDGARYYAEYEQNYPKAIELASKALEARPKAYWMSLFKAEMQQKAGDVAGAKTSAETALAHAKEANNSSYVEMAEAMLKKLK